MDIIQQKSMATEKQIDLIRKLTAERFAPDHEHYKWVEWRLTQALSSRTASEIIQRLLKLSKLQTCPCGKMSIHDCAGECGAMSTQQQKPRQTPERLPDVAAGHYALDEGIDGVKFYRVSRPKEGKWADRTFVDAQASDDYFPIRSSASRYQVLAAIAKDPRAALERYGRELGKCGHCGRTLTDDESRKRGIGPVCATKLGW